MTNPKAIITIEFKENANLGSIKDTVLDAMKEAVECNYALVGIKYKLIGVKEC